MDSRPEEDLDKDNQTESRKKEEDAQILKASAPDNFTFCPLFLNTISKYSYKPPKFVLFLEKSVVLLVPLPQTNR